MKSDSVAIGPPAHVGIIMDGNGRWATKRLLPRSAGHRAGVKNITPVVSAALNAGVKCVTLFAFSTENAGRPKDEVNALVDLIRKQLRPMTRELIAKGARVMFSGELSYFPQDVRDVMTEIANENTDPDAQVVNIALNYSARAEILRAARLAAVDGDVENNFERHLYTFGLPALDMIVRTGGEKRLSNFLLYQAAYSELFFSNTLWPDFGPDELTKLFDEYAHRTRRFGKL